MAIRQLIRYTSIFFYTLFFTNCQQTNSDPAGLAGGTQAYTWLLFKNEQQLEIWNEGRQIAAELPFSSNADLPVGKFELLNLPQTDSHALKFPNTFYAAKLQVNSPHFSSAAKDSFLYSFHFADTFTIENTATPIIYIFPNDIRKSGSFEACFRCPHWLVEVYSFLEISLMKFPSKDVN